MTMRTCGRVVPFGVADIADVAAADSDSYPVSTLPSRRPPPHLGRPRPLVAAMGGHPSVNAGAAEPAYWALGGARDAAGRGEQERSAGLQPRAGRHFQIQLRFLVVPGAKGGHPLKYL